MAKIKIKTFNLLVDYGMTEEMAGRMEQVVNFHKLSKEDMRNLLLYKTQQLSAELEIKIELDDNALEALLEISFGTLGVHRPMNIISSLAQNTVAEAFFEDNFDNENDIVVITDLDTAIINKYSPEETRPLTLSKTSFILK